MVLWEHVIGVWPCLVLREDDTMVGRKMAQMQDRNKSTATRA